jgi:hypothetical protein
MISFDNSPPVYWLIGYLLAGFVIFASQYKSIPTRAYLLTGVVLLVFMRLPVIVFNRELNQDESQMLSHAVTLFQNPVYWRSVDGTTIGPLDNYLLVIPKLFGFQLDYSAARYGAAVCRGRMAFAFFFGQKLVRNSHRPADFRCTAAFCGIYAGNRFCALFERAASGIATCILCLATFAPRPENGTRGVGPLFSGLGSRSGPIRKTTSHTARCRARIVGILGCIPSFSAI